MKIARMLCAALALGASSAAAQEQHTEAVAEAAPEEDVTTWSLAAGGLLNTGNTRSWQLNAGTELRLVRGQHAFEARAGLNYGQADLPDDGDDSYQDTVRNSTARARYDYFLTPNDALFAALAHRWDTFAGLDTRLQAQAGYLRNLFKEENHRLWGEVGYDFTYDNFDPDPLIDPDTMMELRGHAELHSARLFLGYDNQLNPAVRFNTGIEALFNFEEGDDVRLAWESALRSTLVGQLQLELAFTLQFDNVPVPGAEKVDTTTRLSLIYALL